MPMRISELADATDERPRTLRFYETVGLLPPPPRTAGNYRDYPDCTVAKIGFIRSLQAAGLALGQIAAIVHTLEDAPPISSTDKALIEATLEHIDTQLDTLRRTRRHLKLLAQHTQSCRPADSSRREPSSTTHDNTR